MITPHRFWRRLEAMTSGVILGQKNRMFDGAARFPVLDGNG